MTFTVSAPLIPLLPDGNHYPQGYSLPKRQRNKDALDIPRLIKIFRQSLLYEEKSKIKLESKNNTEQNYEDESYKYQQDEEYIESDLAVLGVLSPYSLLQHVMIMEISDNRYLPGPESFCEEEWKKISDLSERVVHLMKKTNNVLLHHRNNKKFQYAAQCCGFNWSPFAWGEIEEKMSCQSIISKFHMMIWQWSYADLLKGANFKANLPEEKEQFFFYNDYNKHFAKLVLNELGIMKEDRIECGPRGLFIPFDLLNKDGNKKTLEENIHKMRSIALVVEKIIKHLNQCLTYDSPFDLLPILKETSHRNLTDEELEQLRKNPALKSFNEAILSCNNETECKIIKSVYPAVKNRSVFTSLDTYPYKPEETWMKGFGFSMVMCESKIQNVLKSGLYICLKAMCGSGGVVETLGCYLKRTEQKLANDDMMVKHNHSLWVLKKYLEDKSM